MKKLTTSLGKHLGVVRTLGTKKVFAHFAHKFEFVYFGSVSTADDEQLLIRGVTLAPRHRDFHYTVGNFRGHDMVLVERHTTLSYPNRPDKDYRWLILQIDLRRRADVPKLFMDAHHHDDLFYANLSAAFAHFANVSHLFAAKDPLFAKHFKIFAHASAYGDVSATLDAELTAMLAHHFHQFDYEFEHDRILIYASNTAPSLHVLQEMMRVGLWLAEKLDSMTEAVE